MTAPASAGLAAVVCPVWARDEDEGARLVDALGALSLLGVPVYAADGGSDAAFLDALAGLPNLRLLPKRADAPDPAPRLSGQIRRTLDAARKEIGPSLTGRVLYTEPDKGWFFENRLRAFLDAGAARPDAAGVLVAARDDASFATYPAYMRRCEAAFNGFASDWLPHLNGADVLYGPLLLSAPVLSCLDDVTDDLGWGWRTFALAWAHGRGLPVGAWVADLPCPPDQRGEDAQAHRRYRLAQMGQNVTGLARGVQGWEGR